MSKYAFRLVLIFCIVFILTGVVVINNGMPQFVKDESNFNIEYSISPLNFKVETTNYSIDMNGNLISNIGKKSSQIMTSSVKEIEYVVNKITDSMFKMFDGIKSIVGH
ncbi:hypothetical protein H2684_00935 [Clostridium sp. cel8]|jgi:hypothetical protein|uniref:hypothetical protein n=1 Tax=Clostridium sp. cel8 TaxID=2663123 RepID=UPI0015F3EE84|nr:hypothetical protein [Clostridium sp. cel8]MBA5849887.1 hypothetical protein [Clostridium sp. cel8]